MMMIPILTLCVYVMKRVWVRTVKFDIFSDSILQMIVVVLYSNINVLVHISLVKVEFLIEL